MERSGLLDYVPLWGLFTLTLVAAWLAIVGGFRLGKRERLRSPGSNDGPVGVMVASTCGLLAFLLGFAFSGAASRFESRRMVVLDEANAVGTTYLRAGMLPEPHRSEVRKLLRQYVDIRLAAVSQKDIGAIRQSEGLHSRLWEQAVAVGEKSPASILVGLFIQSLNDLIDLHAKRLMFGLRSRLPVTVWVVLYSVMVLGLAAMGYHAGLAGSNRSYAALAVCLTMSVVIWLIADLDRPQQGLLVVSQQAMLDVQSSMIDTKP